MEYFRRWEYHTSFSSLSRVFKTLVFIGLCSHWVGCAFFLLVREEMADPSYEDANDWSQVRAVG